LIDMSVMHCRVKEQLRQALFGYRNIISVKPGESEASLNDMDSFDDVGGSELSGKLKTFFLGPSSPRGPGSPRGNAKCALDFSTQSSLEGETATPLSPGTPSLRDLRRM
jgi:hypothetical protein